MYMGRFIIIDVALVLSRDSPCFSSRPVLLHAARHPNSIFFWELLRILIGSKSVHAVMHHLSCHSGGMRALANNFHSRRCFSSSEASNVDITRSCRALRPVMFRELEPSWWTCLILPFYMNKQFIKMQILPGRNRLSSKAFCIRMRQSCSSFLKCQFALTRFSFSPQFSLSETRKR